MRVTLRWLSRSVTTISGVGLAWSWIGRCPERAARWRGEERT